MSQQAPEDKKPDFSNLPRGAIGIKGLPISRTTRLPSIRSPRDLTLGTQPKRTFVPNIPVRREKRSVIADKESPALSNISLKTEKKPVPFQHERGFGRGRNKLNIVQTEGSVFGEGVASNPLSRKERCRESYMKAGTSSGERTPVIKKEVSDTDLSSMRDKMDGLLRDDFIDDGVEDNLLSKPVIFPMQTTVKKEEKKEETKTFEQNIAEEMNFNIDKIAKFIRKEKNEESSKPISKAPVKDMDIESPKKDLYNVLTNGGQSLVLLQFPRCVTSGSEEAYSDYLQKPQSSNENNSSTDEKATSTTLSSLPEGYIGKLQILKSGKAKVVLGSLHFDLDSVTPLQSQHEVVSVGINENSGELTVLGDMEQKFKFAPNVENLLKTCSSSK